MATKPGAGNAIVETVKTIVYAMLIAGVSELYYAADMSQAGAALGDLPETARFPINVDHMLSQCGRPAPQREMINAQHQSAPAANILHRWADQVRSGA